MSTITTLSKSRPSRLKSCKYNRCKITYQHNVTVRDCLKANVLAQHMDTGTLLLAAYGPPGGMTGISKNNVMGLSNHSCKVLGMWYIRVHVDVP